MFPPPAFIPPKSNIGDALTKKAAANIDVGAMGNKGIFVFNLLKETVLFLHTTYLADFNNLRELKNH